MDWQTSYLRALGIKPTPEAVQRLSQWQRWEGGSTNNSARNNYMNTKLSMPGSWDAIGNGVQGYKTLAQGAQAFAKTLKGRSDYAPLIDWIGSGSGDPTYALGVWVNGPGGATATNAIEYAQKILGNHGGGATTTSAPLPQAGKTQAAPTTQPVTPDKQTTDYQALARSYRAQAIAGLGDIASGQQKATDVFAQTAESMKTLAAPPALAKMVSSMPVVMHDANDPLESQAAKLVQKYLGVNYVWGGSTPKGFDCSGLVQYVYHSLGRAIPRTTYDQWDAGKPVQGDLRPGDAVFFTGSDPANGKPGHEGLYIGGGKFIEAPHTGAVVRISTLADRKDYVGARRFA
jgi:cell wall-associated NlpC family hydrolase